MGPRPVEGIGRDPRTDAQGEPGVGETCGKDAPDLPTERLGRIRTRPGQHDDELVAAEPCRARTFRERGDEDVGDLAEERVAELVPCSIVDLLEVVAVDDEEAQGDSALLR